MSLPLEDIRHSFFNSLDHFPSDLVRTLWLCQSINTQLQECGDGDGDLLKRQQRKQSLLLSALVKRQRQTLLREREQLTKQLHTRKRYAALMDRNKGKSKDKDKENITPNINTEPRYCVCNDVAYGDMIACDNPQCHKEWFHYKCINMTTPPKHKWFCPDCKNINSNTSKISRKRKKI